jgi:hypothetical protein
VIASRIRNRIRNDISGKTQHSEKRGQSPSPSNSEPEHQGRNKYENIGLSNWRGQPTERSVEFKIQTLGSSALFFSANH